jgi:HlyD family type I secretion membrane fusion protein
MPAALERSPPRPPEAARRVPVETAERLPARRGISYESATAEIIARSYHEPGRTTLYWLIGLFAAIIVFMSFVKLDRLVKTPGRMLPVTGAYTVQPMDKQIIRRILVAVGDVVKKGQVLATCDPTFAQADLLTLRQQVDTYDATVRRAQAEIDGKPFVPKAANPYDAVQQTLFLRRQTEFKSGVADLDERIGSATAQIAQLNHDIAHYTQQLQIARRIENMNTELQKPGYVSELDLLNSQNTSLTTSRSLEDAKTGLDSATHTRESLVQQRRVFVDKWHEDALNDLVQNKTLLDAAQQSLIKAQRTSELVDLVAPEDSVVLVIPKLTTGSIAQDAQPLFGLAPLNAPLDADVQIDAQDIGFVQVGDKVTIKLDAYQYLEYGYLEGRVKTIGTDTLTENSNEDTVSSAGGGSGETRSPYYDARVTITAVKLHDVPDNFHLLPGMTLQADIVVGRRTIMWYLVGGALRSGAEAMHEPQ